MEDANNGNINPSNDTNNEELELNLGDELDAEAKVTALTEQNKKLFERAKKAEGFVKTPDGQWIKKTVQPKKESNNLQEKKVDDSIVKDISELKLAEKKRQFGYEHNLSPDETDALFRINPNPTKEDLENPFVKGGIDALRAKKRVESNTPSPSSKVFKVGGKSWGELTPAEKEANWPKRQEHLKGR